MNVCTNYEKNFLAGVIIWPTKWACQEVDVILTNDNVCWEIPHFGRLISYSALRFFDLIISCQFRSLQGKYENFFDTGCNHDINIANYVICR